MASPLDFLFARPLGEGAERLGLPLAVPAILKFLLIGFRFDVVCSCCWVANYSLVHVEKALA